MEVARFLSEQKDWTPYLENLLVSPNQSFKINFSHSVESENDWTYRYQKSRIFWPLLTRREHVRKILKLTHNNWLINAILKRKIIFKFRSSLTKILDSPLSLIWPSTKNFALNFPFLHYRVFSNDVTVAILVSQNNETAAMLVSQTSPVGVELFSYANAFFCSNKFAYMLATWVKTLCSLPVIFLDFHSTKQGLLLVDSWSRGLD